MFTFDQIPLMLAQNANQPAIGEGNNTNTGDNAGGDTTSGDTTGSGTTQAPGGQKLPQTQSGGLGFFLPIMIGFIVLMFIFSSRSQKKQKKERAGMIDALKKGVRVQTIGGILGTVVEVRDNKVVLKIDENNNTRMQMAKTAIQSVLEDKGDTEEAELAKPS